MKHSLDLFKHIYRNNNAGKTLIALHGTGGTEHDFLFLNEQLSTAYNLLGLKGNIDENGAARYFKRKEEGIFDMESMKEEAIKLNEFITEWIDTHEMNVDQLLFLGYSNGANMLLATMFYFPETIKNAVLLRPMLPFKPQEDINLLETTLLIHYAPNDELIPETESIKLIEYLRKCGAQITFQSYTTGHQLSSEEISDVVRFVQIK